MAELENSREITVEYLGNDELDDIDAKLAVGRYLDAMKVQCRATGGCCLQRTIDASSLFPDDEVTVEMSCGANAPEGCRSAGISDRDLKFDLEEELLNF